VIYCSHNGHYPRHSKKYADFYNLSLNAFKQYRQEVQSGDFPAKENTIDIEPEDLKEFIRQIK